MCLSQAPRGYAAPGARFRGKGPGGDQISKKIKLLAISQEKCVYFLKKVVRIFDGKSTNFFIKWSKNCKI